MTARKSRPFAIPLRRMAKAVARVVASMMPRLRLDVAAMPRPRKDMVRIIVFARLPNPTIDYYLTARLAAPGMPPSQIVDIRDPTVPGIDPDGAFVIICRYASKQVADWIDRHAGRLAGVGYFTDDHLGAIITGGEATVGYRLFLYVRGLAPLRRLNRHIDIIWAATPALADEIGRDHARVLPPAPHPEVWAKVPVDVEGPRSGESCVRIVYHATDVHLREHGFIAPIIAQVLAARPNVVFEVTADARAGRHWEGMERVTVLRPTSWPDYLARTRREHADIALVPLLRSGANRARAGTKRIDVVRLGAAGLFSRSAAYGEADDSGEIRLANRRRLWVETLLRLVDEPKLRAEVALASRVIVEAMARQADHGIPDLLR